MKNDLGEDNNSFHICGYQVSRVHADRMARRNSGEIVLTLRRAKLQADFLFVIWMVKFLSLKDFSVRV